MKFLVLRAKFLNKYLKDGKKYNAFVVLNNMFYFLHLKNKNNYQFLVNYFVIIEPLFFVEKKVYMSQLTKFISFLPLNKKMHTILNLLFSCREKISLSKNYNYSYYLSLELYNSLFKTSFSYNMCQSLNEDYLKLKNDSHYKWF